MHDQIFLMCLISGNEISVDAREGVSLRMDKMCEINHEREKLYSIISDIRGTDKQEELSPHSPKIKASCH